MWQQSYQQAPKRLVNRLIPRIVTGLLGVFQLLLWLAIIGLEIGSVYYDAGRGTIYAGFWCSIVFFITWIAMFGYLCCGRSVGCGIYLVVQNLINCGFAIILVVFTALFIQNPCLCYGDLCRIPNWDSNPNDEYDRAYCSARTYRKLPLLKAMLACAVLILASSIAFIIVYTIASIRARQKQKTARKQQYVEPSRPAGVGAPTYYPSTMPYTPQAHRQPIPVEYAREPVEWTATSSSYRMYTNRF